MINSASKVIICTLVFFYGCADRDLFTGSVVDPGLGGPYTQISGTVSGVLKKSDSPFLVNDDLFIEENENLTIEAGTLIYFKDGLALNVSGKIEAIGTKEFPITFTAFLSDWAGIHIVSPTGQSNFNFCTIKKVYLDHTTFS